MFRFARSSTVTSRCTAKSPGLAGPIIQRMDNDGYNVLDAANPAAKRKRKYAPLCRSVSMR